MLVLCIVLATISFMLVGAAIGVGYDPKAAAEKDRRWRLEIHARVNARNDRFFGK